jgi:hypothetical protein
MEEDDSEQKMESVFMGLNDKKESRHDRLITPICGQGSQH